MELTQKTQSSNLNQNYTTKGFVKNTEVTQPTSKLPIKHEHNSVLTLNYDTPLVDHQLSVEIILEVSAADTV